MWYMNITLSVPEDLVGRAREFARNQGTSLNALIRGYLESLAGGESDNLAAQFDALWQERSGHSHGWSFDRDELYSDRLSLRRSE